VLHELVGLILEGKIVIRTTNFPKPFIYVDLFSASPRPEEIVGMLFCTERREIESLYYVAEQGVLDAGVVR
jgi:hypothetical protein